MLYLERNINVNKGQATIDETVILYKGDKNVEIQFRITNSPFKSKSNMEPTFGQLIVLREKADPIFSDVSQLVNGKILFVIEGGMIDDLEEVGFYTFQIRLFNDDKTSRGTLPAIEKGIEIRKPICEDEPLAEPAVTDTATVDESYVFEGNEDEIFDANGNYNATNWSSGMVISSGKLNKIENAIGTINETNQSIQSNIDDYATVDYVLNNYLTSAAINENFVSKTELGDIDAILDAINGETDEDQPEGPTITPGEPGEDPTVVYTISFSTLGSKKLIVNNVDVTDQVVETGGYGDTISCKYETTDTIRQASFKDNTDLVRVFGLDTSMMFHTEEMFSGCTNLVAVLPVLDSSMVYSTKAMFKNCTSLTSMYTIGSFQTANDKSEMFYNCTSLTGTVNGNDYWLNGMITEYANCFYNCTSLDNYNDIPPEWGGPAMPTESEGI